MKSQVRPTYQADDYDDGCVPRHAGAGAHADQDVLCADGGTPMHARDGSGQYGSAQDAPPPGRLPTRLEYEKDGEGRCAGTDGDDGSPHDVSNRVGASVIADGRVSKVVHAANGSSGQGASKRNPPPLDAIVVCDGEESEEQYQNGHEHGSHCQASRVGYLKISLAFKDE